MPSPLVRTVSLTPHPGNRPEAAPELRARVSRIPDGMLAVTYIMKGDLDRLCLPRPAPPRAADRLWEHTCCELFVARAEAAGYHEFNFAPSGEWAAYAFEDYRAPAPPADDAALDPRIAVRRAGDTLELNASIRLDRLSPAHTATRLSLALAAVLEDRAGRLCYWALAHPPGEPDFHHADGFVLALDEVRD